MSQAMSLRAMIVKAMHHEIDHGRRAKIMEKFHELLQEIDIDERYEMHIQAASHNED